VSNNTEPNMAEALLKWDESSNRFYTASLEDEREIYFETSDGPIENEGPCKLVLSFNSLASALLTARGHITENAVLRRVDSLDIKQMEGMYASDRMYALTQPGDPTAITSYRKQEIK